MAETGKNFNLLDEPWVRVLTPEQIVREVSLTDALVNAHCYVGMAGELPTQDIAILRLLLAVLYAVFSRMGAGGEESPLESEDDALDRWTELWETGKFPKEPVAEYLNQWRERFWLFHPERPFYQVPEAAAGTEYASSKLNGTLSESANKVRLFPVRLGREKQNLTFGEAARWLIYVNGFDDTSSKPKGKGLPSPGVGWLGKLGLIVAEGDNLFETLMLNLVFLKDGGEMWESYCPVWELQTPRNKERVEITAPNDPAALLTLQSRRLMLEAKNGVVTGYRLLGGDFFSKANAFAEQMTVWKPIYEKKEITGFQPRRHDSTKRIWREFSAIAETDTQSHRPGVVSWIAALKDAEDAPLDRKQMIKFKIAAVQYGDKDFFVNNVFSDALTLHASLLKNMAKPLRERVEAEIELCGEIANKVGNLASDLEIASGGDGKAGRENGVERYYDRIDQPFREWLAGLNPKAEDVARENALDEWRETAFRIARQVGEELVEQTGEAAFVGREIHKTIGKKDVTYHYSAPEAYNRFASALRKLDG